MKAKQWILGLVLFGAAEAQFVQQAKLVGSGVTGLSAQGWSVALSGDGNTAIVGGHGATDTNPAGAAWIFTRSAGAWAQQGPQLVGSGGSSKGQQGAAVAISADGNTAIVGGPGDNAAWIFTRSDGVWTQQGPMLTGSGGSAISAQGTSVALSGDGNTAMVGGPGDDGAWVFTRSGGVWTQQGGKLQGSGQISPQKPNAAQGWSVALSADGNVAMLGGPRDDNTVGAAWIFTRSGGVWTQQGTKLVGSEPDKFIGQGTSVGLSADGNTALICGSGNSYSVNNAGALWLFTRSNGVWTQQGDKLVGSGGTGVPLEEDGNSAALSADGNTAIIGGTGDNNEVGAAWVFKRAGGVWSQKGAKLVGSGGANASQGHAVALSAKGTTAVVGGPNGSLTGAAWVFTIPPVRDFNGDGLSDVLLYDVTRGSAYTGLSNGDGTFRYVYNLFSPRFDAVLTGDFNGDGKSDLLLYNYQTGLGYLGMSNGDGTFDFQSLFWSPGYSPHACDINGDGKTDFVLFDYYGNIVTAISDGTGGFTYKRQFIGAWTLTAVADFTGDGKADLFVYDWNSGAAYVGVGDGTGSFTFHPSSISPGYDSLSVGDLNGDGKMDVLLYKVLTGEAATGISDGEGGFTFTPLLISPLFRIVILADFTGDGKADLVLYDSEGHSYFGTGNGDGTFSFGSLFWSLSYWFAVPQDLNGDGKADILLFQTCGNPIGYTGLSNGDGTFTYTYAPWGFGGLVMMADQPVIFNCGGPGS